MNEHPTPAELVAFLDGDLSPDREGEVGRHLAEGCAACEEVLAPHIECMAVFKTGEAAPPEETAYDQAMVQAFRRARKFRRHLRREAARALRMAPLLAAGGLQALVDQADIPLHGLGAVEALLERSWALRHDNPREMVRLARAAVAVAERLNPRRYAAALLADVQARAWGELGNALRAQDDLDEAERAFGFAFQSLAKGSGNPSLKAQLYDRHASFLGTRRRFDLAFAALDIVHSTYLEIRDPHLAGRALLIKAIYKFYSGHPEQALDISQQGLELIDEEREPDLLFWSIHNRLWFLVACGRFKDARRELFRHRAALRHIEGHMSNLKLRWLEGQICSGLREWESAEQALTEVKGGFEEAGKGFHAALASLDLALVWMHQERYAEAERLAGQAADAFVALRVPRESLAAVMILKDALEKRMATAGLLQSVVDHLRISQHDPEAQFVPRW